MNERLQQTIQLDEINATLVHQTAQERIAWAVKQSENLLLTTNFSPFEAVLLHMVTQIKPAVDVLWVDSGYNVAATYQLAQALQKRLPLKLHVVTPEMTVARYAALNGGVPEIDDARHDEFTQLFKIAPFNAFLAAYQPDFWLTAIRQEQTDYRAGLSPVSVTAQGIVKVAPLIDWKTAQLQAYLTTHDLPNALTYYDPTKGPARRECGLHLQ
ncbi:phosphoadenosine phosphosulfate reductase domain-containing protein [Ostreibacterium oceani]|uniref:Phosphoadenosine phosphosulfate reductase family protein n=1 Tax=Ostreibacterium oceani TaxID=2654998 RepID=A0A6N7EWS7_9GAMM|nr:phosphoadenosine phosphosulfate reductase family protein [Ostreibacterium oceani]MPV86373.1 phosphoadenosine phosphosulfate reductase family protein [Ostreibacterium oceani]